MVKNVSYQSIDFRFVGQEGLPVSLLMLYERLNVHIKRIARLRIRRLSRQFAPLKEKSQEGKKRVPKNKFLSILQPNEPVFSALLINSPFVSLELRLVGVRRRVRRWQRLLDASVSNRRYAQHRALYATLHVMLPARKKISEKDFSLNNYNLVVCVNDALLFRKWNTLIERTSYIETFGISTEAVLYPKPIKAAVSNQRPAV